MLSDNVLFEQLPHVLRETHFDFLGSRYEGKVRDNYVAEGKRYFITTDRLSCFDVVVTTVPFKGQVLNQLAWKWFQQVQDIVPNHVLDVPDPNVMIVRDCQILPVEVVVRGYLAGSAWRDYAAGRPVSGISFEPGLKQNAKLPEPLITPSTKAEKGAHDEPISEKEILERGLVARDVWRRVRDIALALFRRGQEISASRGLILIDTKYEFGLLDGRVVLADEIHTLDSSRYWVSAEYQRRFEQGEEQIMLDKEPTRQWLLSQGYHGNGPIPEFTDQHRVQIARHYIESFEKIAGEAFVPRAGEVLRLIEQNLRTQP